MTVLEFNYQITTLRDSLWRFAFSLTLNKADADDLLQETLLRAMRYRELFIENTNLQSWAFTILRNTFINEYRRRARLDAKVDNKKDIMNLKIAVENGYFSPESYISEKEIRKAIESLPDEYRIPFVMHTEGFRYKEISEHLNLPLGSVKSRIFIARRKLMEMVKDYRRR